MIDKLNLDFIKETYLKEYEIAIETEKYILDPYIIDWKEYLPEIDFKLYEDIRRIGVHLYPKYPVSNNYFLSFGNPFLRIGIDIVKGDISLYNHRLKEIKSKGWTVFRLFSHQINIDAQSFFESKTDYSCLLNDLDFEEWKNFIFKNHQMNAECLIEYLKIEYFS
ncbi:MAG: hypothetical protein A2086_16240 [Spirochaetes bacterium GWD1_27_9]|nr:MAG: hypothetical protein A2Z98_13835 [Spirochaetes bacterium GWB1_27_13]OHD24480.1 MAG: hypothetical protein A2Y34_15265 [Spirochaetes bacterium GWC1_27_15]OHD28704.1 MAG: hypothetical protein A2086_16240 [Spirochaetes bacterium GWD1_27_9]